MKLLILIPSFNTHKYLSKLLKSINLQTKSDILVIDDGSSPKLILTSFKDQKTILRRNEINKGKGDVIKDGIKYALDRKYTHLLTMDGNLQYRTSQMKYFLDVNPKIDFLLGFRSLKSPIGIQKKIYSLITSLIVSLLVDQKIKDLQCGYRRYRLEKIKYLNLNESGYLLESEILLKNINKNSTIKNIKIDTIYNENRSTIDLFKDAIKFIELIGRYIFA